MAENNWSNKQHGAMGRFHHERGESPYTQGCVFTPYGIVAVYYEPRTERSNIRPYADFSVVVSGRHFNRNMRREFTERGLVIVAHRFAREIHDAQQ